jgi:hypothetical protein
MGIPQAARKARESNPKPVPIADYRCVYGNQNRSAACSGPLATGGRNSSGAGAANGYHLNAYFVGALEIFEQTKIRTEKFFTQARGVQLPIPPKTLLKIAICGSVDVWEMLHRSEV